MSTIEKIKIWFTAAVMLLASLCASGGSAAAAGYTSEFTPIYAQSGDEYNADTNEIFASRTPQEIADKYSEALYATQSYDNTDSSTWYSETPSLQNPYNAGRITEDTLETMIAMTNFYRWLMGCEPLTGTPWPQASEIHKSGGLQASSQYGCRS